MNIISGGNFNSGPASFNLFCKECGELVLKKHPKNRAMFTAAQPNGGPVSLPTGNCKKKGCGAVYDVRDESTYETAAPVEEKGEVKSTQPEKKVAVRKAMRKKKVGPKSTKVVVESAVEEAIETTSGSISDLL